MSELKKINGGSGSYLEWRRGSGRTIEILNIHVNRPDRKKGVGKKMIKQLKSTVDGNLVFAITRMSNRIAKEFYKKIGFREIAVLGKFYGSEDAVMFGIDL